VLLQLSEMVVTYIKTFKDPFLLHLPLWFQSFMWCEIVLQFPFFFVASYAFWKGYIQLTNYAVYARCFIKNGTLFLSFIIQLNGDKFTRNFHQMWQTKY